MTIFASTAFICRANCNIRYLEIICLKMSGKGEADFPVMVIVPSSFVKMAYKSVQI